MSRFKKIIQIISSSSLIRSSSIYTIASFVNAAIPLLLLPVLTRRLTPADYGIVAMFQLAITVAFPIIGMNLEGSITRKFYDKDDDNFAVYIGNCFILVFIGYLLATAFFYLGFNFIKKITEIPPGYINYILIVTLFQFFITVILVIYQVNIKPIKYGIFQIAQSIFNISLTVIFVVGFGKTWDGRLNAQIISVLLFGVIAFFILFKQQKVKFKINFAYAKHALSFGIPLIPHAIGGMLFTAIDRFFLTNLIGLDQTGNYTVAYQLGAVVGLITISFNNAYVPWLYKKLQENDPGQKARIVKFTYLYFLALAFGAVLLLAVFPIIVNVFVGKTFISVNDYAGYIIFGFVFQGMYYMVTNYITYARKTYLQAMVTIFMGLLKIPITYYLIKHFGAVGASMSYCFTFLIYFILTWILSARVYKMPWFAFK